MRGYVQVSKPAREIVQKALDDYVVEDLYYGLRELHRGTANHCYRTALGAVEVARRHGERESQLVSIAKGALLHDIGKLDPEMIVFLDHPQLIPKEDMDRFRKKHCVEGYAMAYALRDDDATQIILEHHNIHSDSELVKYVLMADRFDNIVFSPVLQGREVREAINRLGNDVFRERTAFPVFGTAMQIFSPREPSALTYSR